MDTRWALFGLCSVVIIVGCQSPPAPKMTCGGLGDFGCPAKMYCYYEKDCGGLDLEGICVPRPDTCPTESNPVCGCDDKTYSNPCYASVMAVSIKAQGACKTGVGENS